MFASSTIAFDNMECSFKPTSLFRVTYCCYKNQVVFDSFETLFRKILAELVTIICFWIMRVSEKKKSFSQKEWFSHLAGPHDKHRQTTSTHSELYFIFRPVRMLLTCDRDLWREKSLQVFLIANKSRRLKSASPVRLRIVKQDGRLAPAYFSQEYKYFDQHLPTVKNETTV